MLLAITAISTQRTIWILIAAGCSRKRLQVSDDCTQVSLAENIEGKSKGRRTFAVLSLIGLGTVWTATVRLRGAEQDGIIGMRLDVFLQVLGAFESFTAEVAFVRLQRNVNADVGCNVITLNCGGTAVAPLAGEVQVVGALAAHMTLTNVVLYACYYADGYAVV